MGPVGMYWTREAEKEPPEPEPPQPETLEQTAETQKDGVLKVSLDSLGRTLLSGLV